MTNQDKQLESMIEQVVERKLNGINKQLEKLDDVCDELNEIKKLLAGDKKYNIEGMKYRQDEMWENHLWWRQNREDAQELLDSYKNWRWFFNNLDKWIGLIGFGTLISVIIGVLNLFQ